MPYAPTLTVSADMNPCPRVLVTFTALAAGTQTINVTRVVGGRSQKVNGGVALFALGGAAVMDYAPAVGVPSSYRADMFDAAGNPLGSTDAAQVTVPASVVPDASYGIITQPLKPTLAVAAPLDALTADEIIYGLPGDVRYPEGAAVGTRIGSRRHGIEGMKLVVKCQNYADAAEFRSMFGDYETSQFPAILCVRTLEPVPIPRVLYASVRELRESTDYINQQTTFNLVVDEVAPPSPGLIIPILRRMDLDAAFPTRAARSAAYSSRLARDTDFSKAGLAG
ncbi:hypothetical protein ACF1AJ_20420 [Leifsonia sp. NPDC014704]|uniref:hypothetical protein n=1 Tax=Leifsonia sp. NPDC014704 TaxID=3364123 RepID=UPI0036F46B3C